MIRVNPLVKCHGPIVLAEEWPLETFGDIHCSKQSFSGCASTLFLGILIWRRRDSLPIASFAQKQDTRSVRSNTLKRDFCLNAFTVC